MAHALFLDDTDPLSTLDALSLLFSDNWFDSNFGNNERFLLITSALELVFINALIDKGAGTESAFKLYKDGDISGAQASGYLGTLKGSWKLVKIHPEFLPKVFTDANLVVDPVATSATAERSLRQVVALAAYKNAIQTYEHFSDRRQQDGGTRFKGTEYVQDFSYDCWVIDQLSEGVVPLFLPDTVDNLAVVGDSFTYVAQQVAAELAATPLEAKLRAMCADILQRTSLGLTENFFDCGGNSLRVMELTTRVWTELRLPVNLGDVYTYPTVQQLASHLSLEPSV